MKIKEILLAVAVAASLVAGGMLWPRQEEDPVAKRQAELKQALSPLQDALETSKSRAGQLAEKVAILEKRVAKLEADLQQALSTRTVNLPRRGLAAWWKLDEKTGRIARDSSGKGRHAQVLGSPRRRPGRFGGAYQFDGVDDGLVLAVRGPAGFLHDAFSEKTVSLWVYQEAHAMDGVLFEEGGATSGLALRFEHGRLRAACRSMDMGVELPRQNSLPPRTWHHIAVVFRKGRFSSYINGDYTGQARIPMEEVGRHNDDAGLAVCRRSDALGHKDVGGLHFKGAIDEVRIYDRALLPEEIQALATGKPVLVAPALPPAEKPEDNGEVIF